jgi:hypothetical protein
MDVSRYLNGDVIEARPPSAAYRLRKTAARHSVALATTAIVMFALVAGTGVSIWQAARANREARNAWEAEERAVAAKEAADAQRNAAVLAQRDAEAQREKAEVETARANEEAQNALKAEANAVAARKEAEDARDHARQLASELLREKERVSHLYFQQILVDVMSGNDERAQRGIEEAKGVLGQAEIELLKGKRCLYRWETETAVKHFRAAIELKPTWVLPRCGLVRAGMSQGGLDPIEELKLAAQAVEGQELSSLERLFLAYTQCILTTSPSSLTSLREVVATDRSPLADAFLAEALAHRASVQGDTDMIEEALTHVAAAASYLSDNAHVLATAVFVYLEAIGLEDNEGERAILEEKGREFARRLKAHRDSPGAALILAVFYNRVDDMDGVAEIEATPIDHNFLTYFFVASAKYRQGEYAGAEALLERTREANVLYSLMAEAWTLAFTNGGDSRIRAIYTGFGDQRFSKWWTNESVLLMQGDSEFRRNACEARLESPRLSVWEKALLHYIMNEEATRADEEELVTLAKSSGEHPRSKLSRTYAVFGLKHLGRGERGRAEEHFGKCVDVGFVIQCFWARAFLERLRSDTSWPVSSPAAARK